MSGRKINVENERIDEEIPRPSVFEKFLIISLPSPSYREKRKLLIAIGTVIAGTVILALALIVCSLRDYDRSSSIHVSKSALGRYTKAAVTSFGQECAKIGTDVLARNGSAVDAAIATLLCQGVATPDSMGIGGGFFMTIWDAETKIAECLIARERAPALSTRDMFGGNGNSSRYGGLAVAVPGELLGYWEAHKKYGRLPWSELFNDTIKLCEKGSVVTTYLAHILILAEKRIHAEPTLSEILVNPESGRVWVAGDRIKRPKLAATLRIIAEKGVDVFYNGTIGQQVVDEVQAFGGILQMDDLKNYSVIWKRPMTTTLGNYTMYSSPPPGSGVVLTFMMNVLQGLIPAIDDNTMWQRVVETLKWAYASRTKLADPDFVDISDVVGDLSSLEYADRIRSMIRDDWTSEDALYYGADSAAARDHGTGHTSVLAPDGSAVSVTSTINRPFGAKIRSNSTGIIFNNQMDDFGSPNVTNAYEVQASPANQIEPGKRPFSSTAPTILVDENNKVRLIIGGSGGSKITGSVSIAMMLHLWLGYDIKQAIDARRLHHQTLPMLLRNEEGFSQSVLQYLAEIGHTIGFHNSEASALNAIAVQDGIITANSDDRKLGVVAGY